MKNNNHVQLTGRLGKAPEMKMLKKGGKLTKFTIALNENYINKQGEHKTNTQWQTVSAWGGLATIAGRVLKKGTKVTIKGKLVNYHYTDKDGNKFVSSQVIANEIWASPNS